MEFQDKECGAGGGAGTYPMAPKMDSTDRLRAFLIDSGTNALNIVPCLKRFCNANLSWYDSAVNEKMAAVTWTDKN
jgi:hypothetical protein